MKEWDEAKRQANLAKHGFDFVIADELFDGRPALTLEARSEVETRFRTTGQVGDRVLTLIWTWRDDKRRFISLRNARDEEKRQYRQLLI